jgi:ribosomal-protein-alanine N-acetyltransferase
LNAVAEHVLLEIRPMREADLSAVVASEEAAYTHPWTPGIFTDCLKVGYHCLVGTLGGRIIAHAVMSVAVGEAHVLNLCVHPEWQGRGHGRRLLEHLLQMTMARRVKHMFLEVRASNEAAQALYLAMGFNEIAQRPGYYPAPAGRETALVYARTLIPDGDQQDR